MYLYGASGHAKVIIDILESNQISVEGLYDDDESLHELLGYSVLRAENIQGPLIVSIGNNKMRRNIADSLRISFGMAIHPSAVVSKQSVLKEGTVVMQGAIIQSCVKIGKHCIINTSASVDHDCLIEDYVHISPHVTLCGDVSIGEGSWIGAGTTILPGVEIGRWSVIGAGSVVSKDIPNYVLAIGNRCKIIKSIK
jgi:sugar O-acyltransferase (sialic acid O-acetyltransferase NeuD family)